MRFKNKTTLIIFGLTFLTSCSNSLIDFSPLSADNRLSFSSSIPIQNCNYESKFYVIQDKDTFDIVNKKHNLNYYCQSVSEFDELFFSNRTLIMFFSSFVGKFAIGSEITSSVITYHFYYPEMEDQVFKYFCYTNIVEKDDISSDLNKSEINIKSHILSYDDFEMLQNNKVLTFFE